MMGCSRTTFTLLFTIALLNASDTLAQEVTFRRQATQVGDQSRQQMDCDLDLEMSIQQGGNLVQSQRQKLQRLQQRTMTILEATDAGPHKAAVKYEQSSIALTSDELNHRSAQPVSGKTYHIERTDDALQITYPDGTQPPEEEVVVVQQSMSSFGLPNPLSKFFDGRRVRVGEELELPTELARDLLGFANTQGNVSAFSLKLSEVRPGPSPLAIFTIKMVAKDPEHSRVSMTLTGRMLMEANTCRARVVEMNGPVAVSEVHGPPEAQYEVHSQGEIKVAVKASYRR